MSDERPPDYLYHYTTAEGLKGIVENREIWASDIFSLNDSSEVYHGRDLLFDCLNARKSKLDPNLKKQLIASLEELGPRKFVSTYVCSFSKEGDDLSQWRAYCPHGGYAIGFPTDQLQEFAAGQDGVSLECCVYERKDKLKLCRRFIRTLDGGPRYSLKLYAEIFAAEFACRFKHKAFKSEEEWRLISAVLEGFGSETTPEFRCRGSLVVPYLRFTLTERALWKRVKIAVGPCRHPKEAKAYVARLLHAAMTKHGEIPDPRADQVTISEIPFRQM